MSLALDINTAPHPRTSGFRLPFYFDRSHLNEAPLDILLVEDVSSDALLLRLALDASRLPYTMRTIHGGDEVLPYLHQELRTRHKLPDVIMLDLGLPRLDGFEILAGMATAELAIRAIPVVILTGYEHFDYIRQTYNLCVPAYVTKPCNPEKMREILLHIRRTR